MKNKKKIGQEIGFSELIMGLLLIRRYIIGKAEGKTLEVAVGTGRNFHYYYRTAVPELHCVDNSRKMLDIAKVFFLLFFLIRLYS